MLERSWGGFDLSEVARAAGLTRQTLYNHFDSKAALLVALVDHEYETDRPAAMINRFRAEPSPEGMLRTAARFNSEYLPRIYEWARILYSTRIQDPAAEAAWEHRMRQRKANAASLATRLGASGRLAADWSEDDARDIVFMLLSLHTYEYLVHGSGWSRSKYQRSISRLLERALLDGQTATPGPRQR
jgi:AcrR family transcriptional regulator